MKITKRPSTFLSDEQVLFIFNNPKHPRDLSKEIKIPEGVIGMIKRGQTYSQVTGKKYVKQRKNKKRRPERVD